MELKKKTTREEANESERVPGCLSWANTDWLSLVRRSSKVKAAASALGSDRSSCADAFLPLFPLCQHWPIQYFQSASGNVRSKIFFFMTKIMIIIASNWPNTGFSLLTGFSQVMEEGDGKAEAVLRFGGKTGKTYSRRCLSTSLLLHFQPEL